MPNFQLSKGQSFQLDKGIQRVACGLGWNAGDQFDLDASAFGLALIGGGKPTFYGDGSHAVFYGNKDLKQPNGQFKTADGSIQHSGDDRTGGSGGDDETITIDFAKLPNGLVEIAIWITIYKAGSKKQTFGQVKDSYIRITDLDAKATLAEYRLREGFSDAMAVQVGSFVLGDGGVWEFTAVGAGAAVEIGDVIERYS